MTEPGQLADPLGRRGFLRLLGGGLAVVLAAPRTSAQRAGRGGASPPAELDAWMHVAADGRLTFFTGKTEVGQNIRTSLTQAVADELGLDPARIRMVMADTDLVPFDAGTFGSRTTPQMAVQLRRVAATARELLLDLAARELEAPRDSLEITRDGRVRGLGREIGIGPLAAKLDQVAAVNPRIPLLPAAEWTVAGTSPRKVNGRDFVTGRHAFTTDLAPPGLLHGKVLRPPRPGARLRSLDASAAEEMPGVRVVRDGDFAGITAPSRETAERALAALRAEWEGGLDASSDDLFATLRDAPRRGRADAAGDVERALADSAQGLESSFRIPYIAHAPLEPRAALASWEDGKVTVHTATQRPFGVRGELMQAFGLAEDRARVIVPDSGSGYGGKHSGEAAVEAARLAREAGAPVRLVWTREEEFTWAYFRPAGWIDVRAGIDDEGRLQAWDFHNVNSGGAAIATPYRVAHRRIATHGADAPLRQGSYRGLASVANAFARESAMDDLARLAGLDPLDFRLRNLDDERLRAVLLAATSRFGWDRPAAEGRGHGLACGIDKGGYIANCVELSLDPDGRVRLHRITAAFECGAVVHPTHLRGQVEGCIVMGLGGALLEAISYRRGRISNPAFSRYPVPRFSHTPPIDTVLLDRRDLPSAGGSEAPILAIAPAIRNALLALTGRPLQELPLDPARPS